MGTQGQAHRLRVLVVEDNQDTATSLAMVLRLSGYDVRVAFDAPAALKEVAEWSPDAAILDIGLPSLDGYEVARKLRAMPREKRILLLAVTAYATQEDRRRSFEAGVNLHFAKPADPQQLLDVLAGFEQWGRGTENEKTLPTQAGSSAGEADCRFTQGSCPVSRQAEAGDYAKNGECEGDG